MTAAAAILAAVLAAGAAAPQAAGAAPQTGRRVPGRAEIMDRLRAPAITKVSGLVRVYADCPADMRSEFQSQIAGFAAAICRALYSHFNMQPRRFAEPGIAIHVCGGRTNDARVVSSVRKRADGARFLRIKLPSPGYSDLEAFRTETARGFMLAVRGEDMAADAVRELLLEADPEMRRRIRYGEIAAWLRGEKPEDGFADGAGQEAYDERMLKLCRSVLAPGDARPEDVLRFASRLFLYPNSFDKPFCGAYHCCTFAEAARLKDEDPRIRFAAFAKASQVPLYGGGRGEDLAAAADAYSAFLLAVAQGEAEPDELKKMLDEADLKLNQAYEKACEAHPPATAGGALRGAAEEK